jgi:hypothetical protein
VSRKICGLKTVEVTGEWKRLYNEELYILYSLVDSASNRNDYQVYFLWVKVAGV